MTGTPFGSDWARKTDGRTTERLPAPYSIFADDTTLHAVRKELEDRDVGLGVASGTDIFVQILSLWGATGQEEKREQRTIGDRTDSTKVVGGGTNRKAALQHTMARGHATARKVKAMLKGSRLSLKDQGRIVQTYIHGAMRFGHKTWHPRSWECKRMQAFPNSVLRYIGGVNL